MAFVVPDEGEIFLATTLRANIGVITIGLFTSNLTPAYNHTLGDLGTYGSGAAGTNTTFNFSAGFAAPAADSTGNAKAMMTQSASYATIGPASSLGTASVIVYGAYMASSTGKILSAERFSGGPYTLSDTGNLIKITAWTYKLYNP